jgi:hypothetical protein
MESADNDDFDRSGGCDYTGHDGLYHPGYPAEKAESHRIRNQ